MKARTIVPTAGKKGIEPAGKEIDHPLAWRLCQQGIAEPIDDECRAKLAESERTKDQRLKDRWDELEARDAAGPWTPDAPGSLAVPHPPKEDE